TSRSPLFVNATTEGVVRRPSAFAITLGSPPSITATHELVVPRSMPITLPMNSPSFRNGRHARNRSVASAPPKTFLGAKRSRSTDLDLDVAHLGLLGLGHA